MTREEALAIYRAGQQVVVRVLCEMSDKIESLQKRVDELEKIVARLSKNSSNSSKPPSSDDITKPKPKNKDGESGEKRKIGAQPGHSRNERTPFPKEEIDKFHDYKLASCPECHGEVIFLEMEPRII